MELRGKHYDVEANFDFLTKNYDQKTIPGYNGGVLQYDVSYRLVKSIFYENGQKNNAIKGSFITIPASHKPKKGLLQTTEDECTPVYPVTEGLPDDVGPDCTVTWLANYTYDPFTGCLLSLTYYFLSATCPGDGSGSGTATGSGSGSGFGGGGGGAYPPGGSPTPNLDQIIGFLSFLTQEQKDAIEQNLVEMKQHCLGLALYNYLVSHNKTFNFSVNSSSSYPASYDPVTNNIVIQSTSALTFQAMQEELFHGYQNFTMSGGTVQYLNGPGRANIEFEAKVMMSIYGTLSGTGAPAPVNDANYGTWLSNVTDNWTKYPTSLTSAQMSDYFTFLGEFAQSNLGYGSAQVDPNLNPTAIFDLINSSNCSK